MSDWKLQKPRRPEIAKPNSEKHAPIFWPPKSDHPARGSCLSAAPPAVRFRFLVRIDPKKQGPKTGPKTGQNLTPKTGPKTPPNRVRKPPSRTPQTGASREGLPDPPNGAPEPGPDPGLLKLMKNHGQTQSVFPPPKLRPYYPLRIAFLTLGRFGGVLGPPGPRFRGLPDPVFGPPRTPFSGPPGPRFRGCFRTRFSTRFRTHFFDQILTTFFDVFLTPNFDPRPLKLINNLFV